MKEPRIDFDDEGISFDGDLITYDEIPFTGVIYELNEAGQIVYEGNYLRGFTNGKVQFFYNDGRLESEHNAKRGLADGESREYYQNGNLMTLSISENGVCLERYSWDEDGTLVKHEYFESNRERVKYYKDLYEKWIE